MQLSRERERESGYRYLDPVVSGLLVQSVCTNYFVYKSEQEKRDDNSDDEKRTGEVTRTWNVGEAARGIIYTS